MFIDGRVKIDIYKSAMYRQKCLHLEAEEIKEHSGCVYRKTSNEVQLAIVIRLIMNRYVKKEISMLSMWNFGNSSPSSDRIIINNN
mmetsp:Transcript_10056/g.9731  ORF Transcript_10056/g.9731 Transcript_10056/m.9731 type:complete len:86 (-) Transcript_10056:405-662(-)